MVNAPVGDDAVIVRDMSKLTLPLLIVYLPVDDDNVRPEPTINCGVNVPW